MSLTSSQGTFTYPLSVTPTTLSSDYATKTLYYNFCQTVKFKSTETCYTEANANAAYALTLTPDSTTGTVTDCTTINKLTTDSKYENYDYWLIDEDAPETGFVYSIHRSDQSVNSETSEITTFNKSITYVMYCDSDNSTDYLTI